MEYSIRMLTNESALHVRRRIKTIFVGGSITYFDFPKILILDKRKQRHPVMVKSTTTTIERFI
jgi:hypothetical protein